MRPILLAGALIAALLATSPASEAGPEPQAAAVPAAAPVHSLAVDGVGVAMYPEFRPGVRRYAVTTSTATEGVVTVQASTTDPSGVIRVNGRRAADGEATLSDLSPGDEIAVFVEDVAGVARYSLIYLPAGFPTLDVVRKRAGRMPGYVGLTLSQWGLNPGTPNHEAVVDHNGVPVYVRSTGQGTLDLKRQPNGRYSVSRRTTTPGRTGSALVELDSQFREIAIHETVGLTDTDGHDSILQPDGSRLLIAYEPNLSTSLIDAVIQEISPEGEVVFEWNSGDHVDPATESVVDIADIADYAHINSIAVMDDGDILASFRHLSSVLKIARTPHDGFQTGDIVWRLGGRLSDFDFEFADPSDAGPCAQHTASQLDNGNILVFDNGSWEEARPLCVDAQDPTGPAVGRPYTRVTEYQLDEVTGTATPVWNFQRDGHFALFAGSAQRLPNGNTLIGWAAERKATATEVAPDGRRVWEIRDLAAEPPPPGNDVYFTYRALKFDVPDAIRPELRVSRPVDEAVVRRGERLTAGFACTDRGGSSLRSCGGTVRPGGRLDTSVLGEHTFTAVARDHAGNTTRVTRTYEVVAPYRPDGQIRRQVDDSFVGDDVYGGPDQQQVRQRIARPGRSVVTVVRVQNDGSRAERIQVQGALHSRAFRVAYLAGGRNVTAAVTAGTYRTPRLDTGETARLQVRVTRTRAAEPGDQRRFVVRVSSVHRPRLGDRVATVVRATR